AIVDEYESIRQARADLQKRIQAAKAKRLDDHEFLMQLHGVIVGLLGRKNPELQLCGYVPLKPRVQTAEQQAAAAAKRKATRKKKWRARPEARAERPALRPRAAARATRRAATAAASSERVTHPRGWPA
ncbi:MAG: hypothetical protein ACYCWW_05075, partial [Deltaproteobacteria bacterium]